MSVENEGEGIGPDFRISGAILKKKFKKMEFQEMCKKNNKKFLRKNISEKNPPKNSRKKIVGKVYVPQRSSYFFQNICIILVNFTRKTKIT